MENEQELVRALISGSKEAFADLYVSYKGRLLYFCNRFLKDSSRSEDVIQDIFIQIWESRHKLNPDLSFSGYVHTLSQNKILNILRQYDVHSRFVQGTIKKQIISTTGTEDEIIENDLAKILNEAIENLSPKQKEVFRLSRIRGLTYKEIAELLKISVPTVQEHASLALKKIKEYLSQHADIHFRLIFLYYLIS